LPALLIAEDDPINAASTRPHPSRSPEMTSARTSPGRGPLGPLARYLSTHALLAVTAIVGGLVILGLTAASAGVYDAVAEKDGVSGLDRPTLDHVIAMRTPLANQLLTVFPILAAPSA
jgi:undecaprenyl-diphosphatase